MKPFVIAASLLLAAAGSADAQTLGRASAGFAARAGATTGAAVGAGQFGATLGGGLSQSGTVIGPPLMSTTAPLSSTELTTGLTRPPTLPTFFSILGASSSAATGLPTTLSGQ